MKASDVVHEHPDGGYFVGRWDESHAQWQRPLDGETKRLTGCFAEFQRGRFSPQASLKSALRVARSLYGEIEDDVSCNGGQTDMPCPAALEKLNHLTSRELATWRGTISCDHCGARWCGDYY
ncbi:MAG: hypothetical protein WC378_19645, partial [Opitutaceae bacterium]